MFNSDKLCAVKKHPELSGIYRRTKFYDLDILWAT